ncbi:YihY/virulence factor BrkB family protein [Luteolibacter flavescens]|uniref:YihY/virulence factor BrkB family protein n=1 Tax=Luteolibacter flavescens TaxID=1859460 RepID=A0ABT3FJ84_9BACT|nr:YhjD/YihY/BrkB family envelope integrity protein [Luteolibacter flavescens]MCW1883610.1 YihY/virulence factor BrkB family protein [Luteolibacter flavescens]
MRKLRFFLFLRIMTRRWRQHRHADNAAALAFYAMISLPPLLLIGVTVAGMVLGEKAAHGELERKMAAVLGEEMARVIEGVLQSARIAPRSQPGAFVVAMVTLLYAGSHVLTKLRKTLNLVNEAAPADPSRRWLGRLASRALCAGLILVFGVMLAAGTLLDGFAAYVAARMDAPWLEDLNLVQRLGWLSTYVLLTFAFALILKVLPRRRPLWRHALAGGAFAALVAVSLKGGLDLYFRHTAWGTFIGGGLNFLLLLFWLFASIQAFLAGAEVAAGFSRRAGKRKRAAQRALISRAASQ